MLTEAELVHRVVALEELGGVISALIPSHDLELQVLLLAYVFWCRFVWISLFEHLFVLQVIHHVRAVIFLIYLPDAHL